MNQSAVGSFLMSMKTYFWPNPQYLYMYIPSTYQEESNFRFRIRIGCFPKYREIFPYTQQFEIRVTPPVHMSDLISTTQSRKEYVPVQSMVYIFYLNMIKV
ncbi:hypothetical protein Lalb_Chr21g0312891 [Lupinus albus]|uniref:Uncharacterized protein n=1 Tax=Lupinus albus TaxID=3870 RepID=A0A6A4NJW7_LUPAL|nr:hypothetical protein Lalb_Chr21g0312891 [Lupinus albus]